MALLQLLTMKVSHADIALRFFITSAKSSGAAHTSRWTVSSIFLGINFSITQPLSVSFPKLLCMTPHLSLLLCHCLQIQESPPLGMDGLFHSNLHHCLQHHIPASHV